MLCDRRHPTTHISREPVHVPLPGRCRCRHGAYLQLAVQGRDTHSEALLVTKRPAVVPLPPPQFHVHQREAPYRAQLPPLLNEGDVHNHHFVHTRWLVTTLHTMAAAKAACDT